MALFGWRCIVPNKVLPLSKPDDGIYYHGSLYKIYTLKEGFDFTPFRELAITFVSLLVGRCKYFKIIPMVSLLSTTKKMYGL